MRLVVELDPGEPVCGSAGLEGEPPTRFEGLLGFLALFEALRQGSRRAWQNLRTGMEEESRRAAPALIGLLEREHELAALEREATGAAAGGRCAGISGDPGLGKTSLVEWTASLARDRGFDVLHARGGGLERTLGWGVARQLFERLIVGATPWRGGGRCCASSARVARRFRFSDSSTSQSRRRNTTERATSAEHGLYWVVCNLVTDHAPVALMIDDVQWCDDATLEWLLYLLRRCGGLRLLVVIARRTGGARDARRAARPDRRRAGDGARLTVAA